MLKTQRPLIGIKSYQELNVFTINTVKSQKQDKKKKLKTLWPLFMDGVQDQHDNGFRGLGKADGEYLINKGKASPRTIACKLFNSRIKPRLCENLIS